MISKEEAKVVLKKAGYSFVDDNSVITVLVFEKTNIKTVVKNVKELFIKHDYHASFGVRQTNSSAGDENALVDDETDELTVSSFNDTDGNLKENDIVPDTKTEADKSVKKDSSKAKSTKARNDSGKTSKPSKADSDDDYFDDEDENPDNIESDITLDEFDMDMLLNEESVQFSLEDFGMM